VEWFRRVSDTFFYSGLKLQLFGPLISMGLTRSYQLLIQFSSVASVVSSAGSQTHGPRSACSRKKHFVRPAMFFRNFQMP